MTGSGDGTILMDTCRAIIATDQANKGEMEPMGRQIYETFQPCEVAGVTIVKPNATNYYDLEMWEDLSQLRTVFEEITVTNALVAVAAITPFDRLGITFQFSTKRIRSVAQLHEFSILGRIKTDRREEYQSTGIVGDPP